MSKSERWGVFISYSRSDGEAQARSLRDRLEANGLRLWQDRTGMEGGRDWWLQITAALDSVEFMVVLMTPAALDSDLVRKEWRYARQHGVCVYPVMAADLDFSRLPQWMRTLHFYDLEQDWTKFLNDLRTRCTQRRVPFMAEDLPVDFVPRPDEFRRLRTLVLDGERGDPIAITAALRAAGGYGKTVLACALCHDAEVQSAFDDGILWVTLGQNPGDLTGRLEDLIYLLSGERPRFTSVEPATAMFVDLLTDRDILMVIDDVWDAAHLKPFLQGGLRCARLITTRVLDAVPTGASRVDVDAMRQDEAVALLGHGLPSGSDDALHTLAARLGEWPLLLKLANGALRDRVHTGGQTLVDALEYVNKALDRRGLTFFDARDPAARHQAVARTIELSVERLNGLERARFAELAVFPEDVDIPLRTLERLWARTGGLDDLDTEMLSERLYRLSLTLMFDPTRRYVRLHDVVRRYLLHQLGDAVVARQNDLLDAHRPVTGAWADLPLDEPYFWDHLAHHLETAARGSELTASVLDFRYLAAKTLTRSALATERDLIAAGRVDTDNAAINVLRRRFVQSSHVLNRCTTREDLDATLHSRLQHVTGLDRSAAAFADGFCGPYIRAIHPLPDLPHDALIRTLSAGAAGIWCCAVSPNGAFIVAADDDGVVTVWDAETGSERLRLQGHTAPVHACAVSPDGSYIVSAGYDRRVRIWDAVTGAIRHVLLGHTDGVTDCAVSADGSVIVTASLDETVRIWDPATWTLRRTLSAEWQSERGGWLVQRSSVGHTAAVWACAVSGDGLTIASASSDHSVRLWDAQTGEERGVLRGHTAAVKGCALSPDGSRVASVSADRTLRIWDLTSGAALRVIEGHTDVVNGCAFGPDGSWVVSVAADATQRVWDVATGAELTTNVGHTDFLSDCAVARDGSYIVSASFDGTLKTWDVKTRSVGPSPLQPRGNVNKCAVNSERDVIATGSSDTTVQLWNATRGVRTDIFAGHDDAVRGCAVSPSGTYVVSASADKSLKVWGVESGTERATLLGHRDWVNACTISPDERLIVSASSDKTVCIWDLPTRSKRLRIVAHSDSVNACAFSPCGRFFVSASSDGSLKAWLVDAARERWESPVSGDHRLTQEDWRRMLEPVVFKAHDRMVNDCAIAQDSSFIVSASSDRTLRIFAISCSFNDGTAPVGPMLRIGRSRVLVGHRADVTGCAISPDGTLVASTSEDKMLKVWDVGTGRCMATLHVDGALTSCAWLVDGKRIVAAGAAGVYFLEYVRGPAAH